MAVILNTNVPTQSELLSTYFGLLQSENPDINPNLDPILNILGNVYAGMLSGVYSTIYLYGLNIFPQTANGQFLDIQLAEYGLPPRSAGMYALGNVEIPTSQIQTSSTTFNAGAILTDPTGTLQYTIIVTTVVPASQQGIIPVQSISIGDGFAQPADDLLTLQTPVNNITSLQVIAMNDGATAETDVQIQTRLLNSIQNYLLGGTKSDYQNWCLQASTNVSSSSVFSPSQSQIVIYLLGGQLNINNILSTPNITYSRIVNNSTVTIVDNYIEGKRPYTDIVSIDSCSTYIIADAITIAVQLAAGFTLTTLVTNTGIPDSITTITVNNFIQQEFRRAVILSGQNAQLLPNNSYYITEETLLTQLSSSLSASSISSGIYAQLILNVQLTLIDTHGIVVPNPNLGALIYDLSLNYSNVTVTLLP